MQNISAVFQLDMVWSHAAEFYIGKPEKEFHPSRFAVANDALMSCSRIKNQYIPGSHRYIFIIQMIEPLTFQNNSNLWKIMTMVIIFALLTVNLYPK